MRHHRGISILATAASAGCRLILLPALVVGLSLAFAGGASAQTGFHATITSITPKPKPCPNGDVLCGTATTNFGRATWTWNPTAAFNPDSPSCDTYEAAVTFALVDGSTLVLDDAGLICGPGASFLNSGSPHSFGNPFDLTGSWTVLSATGQFGSITGPGTDSLHLAGAYGSGTYTGAF